MLYVKNISAKPIGFGKFVLLPDEVGPLPDGYSEEHPTIKYYLNARKPYLQKVDASHEAAKIAEKAKAEADRLAAEQAEAERKAKEAADNAAAAEAERVKAEQEAAAKAKADELDKKLKEVAKMNLEPLREMCKELGIAFVETDTKAMLQQKITEKLQAERG